MLTQAPKGTYDVLPGDSAAWQAVEQVMREAAAVAGYREVRTPVFEHTELFQRGVGDTTDVVQKEMYTFLDKGGRSITLKPEGTAGAVRAMIEAGLYAGVLPVKMYYLNAPIFRYEAPQSGRMREHHQFGVEVFGAGQPSCDAEVIAVAMRVLRRLGVDGLTVNINSIGCPLCRARYHEQLRAFLSERMDSLCETCRQRSERNPLRILDCKNESCQRALTGAPSVLDFLCDPCQAHFDGLQAHLKALDIAYAMDPRIVRGLDYYTKTVFEIITKTPQGNLTVCGGGRYDGLVEMLGGPKMPGIGFGMGIERILMLLAQSGRMPQAPRLLEVYVASLDEAGRDLALPLTERLREAGVKAECDHMERSLKAQFKHANKCDAPYVLIAGGEELARGNIKLRDMETKQEEELPVEEAAQRLAARLGRAE